MDESTKAAWKATFVTPASLLLDAYKALSHSDSYDPADRLHPTDAGNAALAALEVIIGLRVAETEQVWQARNDA